MIELSAGSVRVEVDDTAGARLASLVIDGRERLVTEGDPLGWGAYPMVPWAGRVRGGRFSFAGATYTLARRLAPHAIHGTVLDQPWEVERATLTRRRAVLRCRLGVDWPWDGVVTHEVTVHAGGVRCRLTVESAGDAFPAQVGWHPWFTDAGRPPRLEFAAQAMYRRDRAGIPDGTLVAPGPHPWDDCFVGVADAPVLRFTDGLGLAVGSDCDHWVVYEPEHAVCVEPQSGPPDGFSLRPDVVTPGRPLSRTMELVRASAPAAPVTAR